MKFKAILEPAEEGGYVVHVLDPECWTQGDTLEEALEMARDAIEGVLGVQGKLEGAKPIEISYKIKAAPKP